MESDYRLMKTEDAQQEKQEENKEINCSSEHQVLTKHNQANTNDIEAAAATKSVQDFDDHVMSFYPCDQDSLPYIDTENGNAIESSLYRFTSESRKSRQEWTLRLEREKVLLILAKNDKHRIEIDWSNLLGATSKQAIHDSLEVFNLDIWLMKPTRSGCCSGTLNRETQNLTFSLQSEAQANLLATLIQNYSRKRNYLEIASKHLLNSQIPVFHHQLLVFLNPVGGDGTSPQKWQKAKALLEKAGYKYLLVQTKYRNHAHDYVAELPQKDLLNYRGIVTLSGDGIPHEILNGITSRADKDYVLERLTLGALPAGSGNGLVNSLLRECNEPLTLEAATFLVCKGSVKNIDLIEMQTNQVRSFTSFLSLAWAYIADIDLNSEVLRCVGGLRFDIFGAYRALFQKEYAGRLWTTEEQLDEMPDINQEIQDETPGHWNLEQVARFKYLMLMNTPMITASDINAPNAKTNDGFIDLQYISAEDGWSQLVKYALKFQSGKHFNPKTNRQADGMRFTYKKIKAFRLASINKSADLGLISVDGERYDGTVIQGKVLPGKLRVFSL